ncbi:HDOD domain-containing protein [Alteromonas aestuariivivens]|uniref:HDOD domain-containing protein n=1 Tax=Alteromonas aestuariivivens TaxID=1938339 RepID=A0A3D8M9J6_9ALTE|nr:HDOD domain-containing protein [Alteromonas aestuariivivens]RDV26713.1 HDOD domain-containing protein [Alteromonas aestuariivivens]
MTDTAATLPSIDERFDNLLISQARVHQMLGRRSPGEVRYEESEQADARRELLHVEKVALRDLERKALSDASFLDSLRNNLHNSLITELKQQTDNSRTLFNQVLNLTDDATQMLDNLALKASTISKIEPYAAAQPWLYDELIQTVNSPAHRRKDSRGRVIQVESLRTALSFLGIDNLRLQLPLYVYKRTLPVITDPYPTIKHQLWQYGLGTAVTARELTKFYTAKPTDAYVLGLLSNIGRCAIHRLYFRLFDKLHRQALQEAQNKRQREIHDGLLQVQPSANFLIALQNEYADKFTADLFEHMLFKRLNLTNPMRQIAKADWEPGSLAHILHLARCYTRFRMLRPRRYIEKDEAKAYLLSLKYPTGALESLKELDIFQPPLAEEAEND